MSRAATRRLEPWNERLAAGRRLRDRVGRSSHGQWTPASERPDVVASFRRANAKRLEALRAGKIDRMTVSPFAYFRGSAPRMAEDLRRIPAVGLLAQICGDAHVQNVGAYAAADGHLTFDLNDFDETGRGPWEWDLKRFATSLVLAGREAGNSERHCGDAVRAMVRTYRSHVYSLAHQPFLEVIRYKVRRAHNKVVRSALARAERATPLRSLERLTIVDARGTRRFRHDVPSLDRVPTPIAAGVLESLLAYRRTLPPDRRSVLDVYRPVDVAFRIGGVGSMGLKNYVVLFFGESEADPLILQVKQAERSSLSTSSPRAAGGHQGRRIAEGQCRMQSGTDLLVGWTSIHAEEFVVRQLSDHKAGIEARDLRGRSLELIGEVAGEILAKAHARTGNGAAIAGYCGRSDRLDEALGRFAGRYADHTEKDYADFRRAARRRNL